MGLRQPRPDCGLQPAREQPTFPGMRTPGATRTDTKASGLSLTGFLGAGKTTLLKRILTGEHARRVAVIVNQYGEVGIDHHLLLASNQEVVQMNNRCLCC